MKAKLSVLYISKVKHIYYLGLQSLKRCDTNKSAVTGRIQKYVCNFFVKIPSSTIKLNKDGFQSLFLHCLYHFIAK